MLLATIAAATRREESCVLIDASDGFDPISGAAAGVDFNKLLWIRCGKGSSVRLRTQSSGLANDQRRMTNDEAFADDRRPTTDDQVPVRKKFPRNHERRLEQVLKATDLILQSGGFGLVALDLAGIPEQFVRRIPLTSCFRFQRAVEYTKTTLLVVSEFPCAQTCAMLALKFCNKPSAHSTPHRAGSRHQPSGKPSHAQVLEGMDIEVEVVRSRLERKPVQSAKAAFMTQAVRAG